MATEKAQSHSWWFDSHNTSSTQSPWLRSTLSELDEKIKTMLQLMEGDADSFIKRAEMYYRKRPELMNMVEDLYRSHRSLIERYDQMRTKSIAYSSSNNSQCVCHNPLCSDSTGSDESEVEDPEEEPKVENEMEEVPDKANMGNYEVGMMKEEIQKLKEDKCRLEGKLEAKDEDAREAMRKLSWSIGVLEDEDACIEKPRGFFGLKILEGILFMNFFGGHF